MQRFPEYIDRKSDDRPHTRYDLLESETNRRYGRPLRVVAFRWLNPEEV